MIETHPFPIFVPQRAEYLILGSFVGKMTEDNRYDWFYGTKLNQFWSILESVYKVKFKDKKAKQKLFAKHRLAITDIILSCERKKGSNLDNNLTKIIYNSEAIEKIFRENKIKKVFFTSRFVEVRFKKIFKNIIDKYITLELVTLPSPSPRYAKMSLISKVKKYKSVLPQT